MFGEGKINKLIEHFIAWNKGNIFDSSKKIKDVIKARKNAMMRLLPSFPQRTTLLCIHKKGNGNKSFDVVFMKM